METCSEIAGTETLLTGRQRTESQESEGVPIVPNIYDRNISVIRHDFSKRRKWSKEKIMRAYLYRHHYQNVEYIETFGPLSINERLPIRVMVGNKNGHCKCVITIFIISHSVIYIT